jgi:hypothetical protein
VAVHALAYSRGEGADARRFQEWLVLALLDHARRLGLKTEAKKD